FLPEINIDATESLSDRRRDRSLQPDTVLLDGIQDPLGDLPLCFDDLNPAFLHVPVDANPGGIDALACRLSDFRTNSIPGDQRNVIHHWNFLLGHSGRLAAW